MVCDRSPYRLNLSATAPTSLGEVPRIDDLQCPTSGVIVAIAFRDFS